MHEPAFRSDIAYGKIKPGSRMRHLLFIILLLTLIPASLVAQEQYLPLVALDSFENKARTHMLVDGWSSYEGTEEVTPANADSLDGWQPRVVDGPFRQIIYHGDGSPRWYRNRFVLSESLVGGTFYLKPDQIGSMVIYWNGRLVHQVHAGDDVPGSDGWVYSISDLLTPVRAQNDTVEVLIKFWNERPADRELLMMTSPGFRLSLVRGELARHNFFRIRNGKVRMMSILVGFAMAFSVLHFFIYLLFPKRHVFLHYTAFTASVTLLMLMIVKSTSTMNFSEYIRLEYGFKFALVLISLTGMRFMQEIHGIRSPLARLVIPLLTPIGAFLVWKGSMSATYILVMLSTVGWLASLIWAHARKIRGSWILSIGFGAFGMTGVQQAMYTMGVITPTEGSGEEWLLWIGLMVLLVSMALYLAREFALTNRQLEARMLEVEHLSDINLRQERAAREQEVERLRLTEENRRRQVELEETKKRQAVLEELEEAYTQLRQTQSQLLQTEKMASLGRLVAGIAHEINTPVGAVSSMKDTLERAFTKLKALLHDEEFSDSNVRPKSERLVGVMDDAIRVIGSGTDRVSEIVRRLRSFARLDEAELKNIDLNSAIEDTISLVHHQLGGRIEIVREFGEVGHLSCFPARFNQVVLNLLVNSIQAIEGEGSITIQTSREGQEAKISVKDTGSGIPKERLDRIFDPGYTTKGVGVGTGLGLAITYQIIQDHRGQVDVTSEVGKGTTFTVTLPTNLSDLLSREAEKRGADQGQSTDKEQSS